MNITRYSVNFSNLWNSFIKNSKNGTFMLDRNYMDYHSDRFIDNSLMFFDEKDKLVAVMPASLHGNEIRSHGGLTYGGIISDRKMTVQKMLDVFSSLKSYMKENMLSKLIYKRVPSIYYTYPSDEDLYALFINNAKLIRRDISTTIDLYSPIQFSEMRQRNIKKAKHHSINIKMFGDFELFFKHANNELLRKYSRRAIHTSIEMQSLSDKFPYNIKMFGGFLNDEFLAGTIVFITETTVHTQYIVTTELGREVMAFDLVIDYIINNYSKNIKYFDFGISNEQEGRYLNTGLIRQKEMFGGRAIAYDWYEINEE
jgi:hypothetical protein